MFIEILHKNARKKIEAICLGLALCALSLAAAWAVGVEVLAPWVMLDDAFFGKRLPILPAFFLGEAAAMLAVVYWLPRWPRLGIGLGIAAASFLLVETLFDLWTYASDLRLVIEEVVFASIYFAMLVLLAAFGFRPIANPTQDPASAPSASTPPR